MRIGYAQLNTIVGDLDGNLALGMDAYEQLCGQGVDLIIFPELFLCGYPPRDLLHKQNFLPDVQQALLQFARQVGPTPALIGYAEIDPQPSSFRKAYNSAAWCEGGEISQIFRKRLLPTYDVFDEDRYFSSGKVPLTRIFKGRKVAVSICEDVWNVDSSLHSQNPISEICEEKPDLLINLSASPWHQGKQEQRIKLLSKVVKLVNCPLCYVNSIGGNDELVFDGRSLAMGVDGEIIFQAKAFEESIAVHELEENIAFETTESSAKESLRKALVLGVRDYAHKTGFTKALIGLSGGI
ncbi:MAG: NAD+ synthase, partial [Gammaproteobacteria bacterium TMED281]